MAKGPQASFLSHEPVAPAKTKRSAPGQFSSCLRSCDKKRKAKPPNATDCLAPFLNMYTRYCFALDFQRGPYPPPTHPPTHPPSRPPEGSDHEGQQHLGIERAASAAPPGPQAPVSPPPSPRQAWSGRRSDRATSLSAGRTPRRVAAAAAGEAASYPSPLHPLASDPLEASPHRGAGSPGGPRGLRSSGRAGRR